MIWKYLIFAFLATGVLADYVIPEEQKAQFKQMLKSQCAKVNAEDKTDEVAEKLATFMNCTRSLINPETVKQEIEVAKPNGEIDEVFKKYCDKSPLLKACIGDLMTGLTPCLGSEVTAQIPTAINATNQLLDFICFKDGDRIALFIAEGGPECFQSQETAIRKCTNNLRESVPSVEALKAFSLEDKCKKFDELSVCVTAALEKCNTPTPANIAESLFRFVRNGSPCKDK